MYRFRRLDISHTGPFGSNSVIEFDDGVTIIEGGNGLGKTTICKALRGEFPNVELECDGSIPKNTPNWIVYFEEIGGWPKIAQPWDPLSDLLIGFSSKEKERFVKAASSALDLVFTSSWMPPARVDTEGRQYYLSMGAYDAIDIFDATEGSELPEGYESMNEALCLYLALNAAARQTIRSMRDLPLVIDGTLAEMDSYRLSVAWAYIQTMAPQIIVLENQVVTEHLDIEPDYRLVFDDGSQRFGVVRFH